MNECALKGTAIVLALGLNWEIFESGLDDSLWPMKEHVPHENHGPFDQRIPIGIIPSGVAVSSMTMQRNLYRPDWAELAPGDATVKLDLDLTWKLTGE